MLIGKMFWIKYVLQFAVIHDYSDCVHLMSSYFRILRYHCEWLAACSFYLVRLIVR